eukprot:5245754-Amphidinium_carterae.1
MQKKHGKEKYPDTSDQHPPSADPPQHSTAAGSRDPMPEQRHEKRQAPDAHLRSSDWTKFGLLEKIEYNAKRLKQTPSEVPWRAGRQPMPSAYPQPRPPAVGANPPLMQPPPNRNLGKQPPLMLPPYRTQARP